MKNTITVLMMFMTAGVLFGGLLAVPTMQTSRGTRTTTTSE